MKERRAKLAALLVEVLGGDFRESPVTRAGRSGRAQINRRYRELKSEKSFGESMQQAREEWVAGLLQDTGEAN